MFDSCPAYQDSKPHLLCLAHCVPDEPNKGEKIRLYHTLRFLAPHYRIHLACFARAEEELESALELRAVCETGYVELLRSPEALMRGGISFLAGKCLNAAYFQNDGMQRYVSQLARDLRLHSTLVYTAVMAPYAPPGVPMVLDMVDVDSEKWLQYSESRFPKFLYRAEARRLREFEARWAKAARCTVLTTANEEAVLRGFVPVARSRYVENGVEFDFFDGERRALPAKLEGRRFVLFTGTMDYYPNAGAAVWFAKQVFPALRDVNAGLEFVIAGRNPAKAVRELATMPGIHVTGSVPDVRPYIAAARAIVAPLQVARGVQNKVLEALAMGREVYASEAVCRTFGEQLPEGVIRCESVDAYVDRLRQACRVAASSDSRIRDSAKQRFTWGRNLAAIGLELAGI